MIRMPVEVAVSVVRGWAFRSRLPMARPGLLIAAVVVAVMICSVIFAVSLTAMGPYMPSGAYFSTLILLSIYLLVGLVTITTSAAAAQSSSTVVWWRTTPISDRGLAVGFSMPVWLLVIMQALIVTPGLVLLWADSMGVLKTTVLSLSAIVIGAAHGRGLFALARILLSRAPSGWQVYGQPLAFVLWAAYLAGAVSYMRGVPISPSAETLAHVLFPLGYPALTAAVLYPGVVSAWALVGAVAVAVAVEVLCLPWSTGAKQDSGPVLKVGPTYSSRGSIYIWRLEITRLIRRRRVQSALLSAVVIQAGLCVLVTRLDEGLRGSTVDNALLLNSLMVAYAPLLARGMSDRSRPYALWMGMRPDVWAATVTAGAVTVALGAAIPALVVLTILVGSWNVFVAGIGLTLFMATLATAVGFVLLPSDDTGAAETLGAGIVIGVTFGAGKMLASFGFEELWAVALILAALAPLIAIIPAVAETLRWKNILSLDSEESRLQIGETATNEVVSTSRGF